MTRAPEAAPAAAATTPHHLWTIARIQNVLSSEVLIRRFLLDLTHAPEPRVMEVFTAWRRVAASIEAYATQEPATGTPSDPHPAQHGHVTGHLSLRHPAAPDPE